MIDSRVGHTGPTAFREHVRSLFSALLLAVAAASLLRLYSFVGRGFDLTDEGYMTLIAMYPDNQSGQLSFVGYLTTFLWRLSNDSIPAFRLLGMAILLACVLGMVQSAMVYARSIRLDLSRSERIYLLAASLGALPFFYRELHEVTPSYNWLVMVGLLVVQSGHFLALSGRTGLPVAALIAVGGFLAFAAKPTSGVGVLVLLLAVFLATDRRLQYLRLTGLALLMAGLFGLLSAVFLGGGLVETYEKYLFGVEYYALAQTGHTVERSLGLLADALLVAPFRVFLFTQKFTIIAIVLASSAAWWMKWHGRYTLAGILLLSAAELSLHDVSAGSFNFYLLSSFVLSLLVGGFALRFAARRKPDDTPIQATSVPLLFGVGSAVCLVFGTNTGPGYKLLLASVSIAVPFVLVGRWFERSASQRGVVASIALLSVLAGVVLIHRGAADPFRNEGGMRSQTVDVSFLNQSAAIRLDPMKAAYANSLLRAAKRGGWRAGTPLLSLTGYTPGANVILDAQFVSIPWLIAQSDAYAGGQDALRFLIAAAPNELIESAWLLTSTNGNRRLDPRAVGEKGCDFPSDYTMVGSFSSYTGDQFANGSTEIHRLWRPSADPGRCSDDRSRQ